MAYGDFIIQHDLSFTIAQGEIFVIMGGSGCGSFSRPGELRRH
jgi:phospholipid/cholesterol/gamma-HCH transport system ATP-binding protein